MTRHDITHAIHDKNLIVGVEPMQPASDIFFIAASLNLKDSQFFENIRFGHLYTKHGFFKEGKTPW